MLVDRSGLNRLLAALVAAGVAGGGAVAVEREARADVATTGGVRGVVRDKATGEVAAGATVVVTSPALQGDQTEMTDGSGGYYLTALPPGIYYVTVYYLGGQFARSDVLVQVGKTAVVNITVDTTAVKGTVYEFEGAPPIVDQGSTKIGQNLTSHFTNNIPNRGTLGGTIASAAGAQTDNFGASFAGATSAENTYVVEGLNTTDTGYGVLSSNLPNEFISETEIITGGYNAEYGRATGAIVNVVTKSGSNELHGSVFGHYAPSAMSASALTLLREGTAIDRVTNQDYNVDFGAELGGPIIKDKLWFHVGFTPSYNRATTTRIVTTNVDVDDDGIEDVDPETGFTRRDEVARRELPSDARTYFFTAKLTGAVSANHQWQIAGWGNPQREDEVFDTVRDPTSSRSRTEQGAYDVSAKWTSKFNDGKTQIDAVAGYHNGYKRETPLRANEDVEGVRFDYTRSLYDFADLEGGGIEACNDNSPSDRYKKIMNCPVLGYSSQGLGFLEDRTNNRTSVLLSATQRVRLLGQHIIKVGIDAEISTYNSGRRFSGGAFLVRNSPDEVTEDGMPIAGSFQATRYIKYDPQGTIPCGLNNSSTCSVVDALSADTTDRSLSAYIQDSWQILPNLTLNAGLRWEQQVGYVAEFLQGTNAPDTGEPIPDIAFKLDNLLAPRLGFIFDPTSEGKAKLMGHYGRFYENVPMDINVRAFGGETTEVSDIGVDTSGNLDNSCPFDHRDGGGLASMVLRCSPSSTHALGGSIAYVAPGLKGQFTEEYILGGEYEVMPALSISANLIRRTLPRIIEDMSTDGGANYLFGNPGENFDSEADALDARADSLMASNSDLADLYRSRAEQLRNVKRFDKPSRDYHALQLSARTRATRNSLLIATYTYSRTKGNYPGLFSTETNQLDPNLTSMYDLPDLMPNRYGPSGLDRPHNLKIDGFYQFDLKKAGLVIFGASLRAQSGIPGNALASHPTYGQGESYLLPRGAGYRTPASMNVDTHLSYGYQLGETTRLEGFLEIFNLFNQQPETAIDPIYTTDSAQPVVGGELSDLEHAKSLSGGRNSASVIIKNRNFGKTNARQAPMTGQIGFRLTF